MSLNYRKLRGRIVEICGTQAEFSKRMGCSEKTISLKLNGKIMFDQKEIDRAISILKLTLADIPEYFFSPEVKGF